MFDSLDSKPDFPKLESKLVQYWKDNKIFEKSVENRPLDKKWTFLDGPPFITGMPHYGTLLSSLPKDLFPRYWTMKGYRVRRVWGWDCHGLPAENKVENKLGLKSKKEIEEKIGIQRFIDECKLYVSEVSGEWEWYVDHIARWVDFKNAYRTMDTDYMETVMWVFKQMYDKNHIYKDVRVSLYCPHCSTPISNFEVAMDSGNYKDIQDTGTVYKYALQDDDDGTYFLAWSTTPWTKVPTSALAVNPDLTYVKVQVAGERYILAEETLNILKNEYQVLKKMKGSELIGLRFKPHYDYYKIDEGKKAFVIVGDEFVTSDEGTGIVTLAAYGEDDLRVMKSNAIHIELHLDDEGHMYDMVPNFGGMYYLKANKLINEDLKNRGLVYSDEPYTHSMPHCWRCGTQLYYAPQDAWFVNIQNLKPQLFQNNKDVNWYPDHFKYGRFQKSMEAAPDWCISRSRYWGSPVPVWECSCGTRFVPGSISELEKASGQVIDDLHKPGIDGVTVTCNDCGKSARRVPEVLDSWIEAGSSSFAERHYPFNSDQKLEDFFPPDFIVEYTGQIRAWFYVLHVIGTALLDSKAFKNVAVTGVILGTDGRKMSKNFGNYPDPRQMLEKYGGDALRLYLMGSPVMKGEDIIISEEEYRNQLKMFHIPLWNIFKFFTIYAELDGIDKDTLKMSLNNHTSENILDVWVTNLLYKLRNDLSDALDSYDSMRAIKYVLEFIDELSKWYLRRSRDRVGPTADDGEDSLEFYRTIYYVLVEFSKLTAPIVPFFSETIYRYLTQRDSVHLEDWPEKKGYDAIIIDEMNKAKRFVELGHKARKDEKIKVRQPLSSLTLRGPETSLLTADYPELHSRIAQVMKDELNVKEILFEKADQLSAEYDLNITQELEEEGLARELVRTVQNERRKMELHQGDVIDLTLVSYPKKFEDYIKRKVGARNISIGSTLSVTKVNES